MSRPRVTSPTPLPPQIDNPWVLVLGGVTPLGHRRAQRIVSRIAATSANVIWVDGFERPGSEHEPSREVDLPSHVTVISFARAQAESLAGRLIHGGTWRNRPLLGRLWRSYLRRLGGLLRPRSAWRVIKTEVHRLSTLSDPEAIVFCDDYALTSAWNCARIWPEVPVVASWPLDPT